MMFAATKAIKNHLDHVQFGSDSGILEINAWEHYEPERSEVDVRVVVRGAGPGTVRFLSYNNNMDVSVRLFNYGRIKVDDNNREAMLRACNRANDEYRFLKFTVDTDDTINVEYDFPFYTDPESVGPLSEEILRKILNICAKTYQYFNNEDDDRY